MRRVGWALSCLLLGLSAACTKPSPGPGQGASASQASASAASSATSPAKTTGSAAVAPASPVACALAFGYRGTVAGQPVFARLGVGGKGVYGRYFYERAGIDIALSGKLSTSGEITLTETTDGKSTGTFEGTCDGATGALAGTWKGGKTPGRFELTPIAPSETPVVATKRYAYSRPAPKVAALGIKTCSYKETRIELFGLRDADAERMLGSGLEVATGPVLDSATALDITTCDSGMEAEVTETLVGSFREIATIQRGGFLRADQATHPTNFLDFSRTSYDLRTGKAVVAADVFARGPIALVRACLTPADAGEGDPTLDIVGPAFSEDQFDLTPEGVHFFGVGFPFAYASQTGLGPTIRYDVLLRDDYLKKGSPVARAWDGVKPAGKAKRSCPDLPAPR